MSAPNFDITKHRGGAPKTTTKKTEQGVEEQKAESALPKYEKTVYTTDEQGKLLIGYDEVSRDQWMTIKPGSHIRYSTNDGDFRRGGFVQRTYVNSKSGKDTIHCQTSMVGGPNIVTWPVTLENIAKIWKKRTANDQQPAQTLPVEPVVHQPDARIFEQIAEVQLQIQKIDSHMLKMMDAIVRLNTRVVSVEAKLGIQLQRDTKTTRVL